MVNEMKTFKKMSAIPTEKDFVDEVVALQKRALKAPTYKVDMFIRWFYVNKVHSAKSFFLGKIFKVWEELPSFHQTPPRGLRSSHLGLARNQLLHAWKLIHRIDMRYAQLLKSDDCDSLDQCKRLNGAALALMFTVAMRCLPNLTYLDKVRQLMVDLEDGKADTTVVKHAMFLSKEDCTVLFVALVLLMLTILFLHKLCFGLMSWNVNMDIPSLHSDHDHITKARLLA